MAVNYLVIYVANLDQSRLFYESLGVDLVKEQHGKGPMHYSFENNDVIYELYPAKSDHVSRVRIGLKAMSSGQIGKHTDPDGNTIHFLPH